MATALARGGIGQLGSLAAGTLGIACSKTGELCGLHQGPGDAHWWQANATWGSAL